jgi:hypothetical protein
LTEEGLVHSMADQTAYRIRGPANRKRYVAIYLHLLLPRIYFARSIRSTCAASGLRQAGLRVLVLERDTSALSRRRGYLININSAGDASLRACLPASHYLLYQLTSHRQLNLSGNICDPNLWLVLHRAAAAPSSGLPPAAVDRATLRAILLAAAQTCDSTRPS